MSEALNQEGSVYETTDFSDRHGAAASSPARRLRLYLPLLMALLTLQCHGTVDLQPPALLLPFEQLPSQRDLPEALITMSGKEVTTPQAWWTVRRPEIEQLFAHYMYGAMPEAPEHVEASLERIDPVYFGGTATKKRITIRFGPQGTPPIHLLLIVPNDRTGPAPVFLGLNFYGNHSVLDDPEIPLTEVWLPGRAQGVKLHRATEAARGTAALSWSIEEATERGYAVATFCHGDVDPDCNDFTNGIHPHYLQEGRTERGPHDWGTVAAWAWGLHRAVDYIVTDPDIDAGRIAVMGHSRNGKAALLAGALDERIALVVSNQSGCGGADCDDTDPLVSPGRKEVPGDGIDNDCDGSVDEPCFFGAAMFD